MSFVYLFVHVFFLLSIHVAYLTVLNYCSSVVYWTSMQAIWEEQLNGRGYFKDVANGRCGRVVLVCVGVDPVQEGIRGRVCVWEWSMIVTGTWLLAEGQNKEIMFDGLRGCLYTWRCWISWWALFYACLFRGMCCFSSEGTSTWVSRSWEILCRYKWRIQEASWGMWFVLHGVGVGTWKQGKSGVQCCVRR